MKNLKEEILRVVRLEEVVERYLPLERIGGSGHTLTGLCPFHADRHPSLRVRTDRQYYKCFACGAGGDVFRFVEQMEGCNFREALVMLAGWYGLCASSEAGPRPSLARKAGRPEPVAVASPAAVAYLLGEHQVVLSNLTAYVPADAGLVEAYRAFEVGLAPASLPVAYRDLCGRLVFPIRNEAGVLVAFAGRYVGGPDKKGAKYVNSPTSVVYQKDRLLYGLYQAVGAIRRHGFVYITEGYKDVLAMHAAGFAHTVALCGTALTVHHVALLRRYTGRVVLMLDGDAAGQEAMRRCGRLLSCSGLLVSYLTLAPGEDPDSLWHSLGGRKFVRLIHRLTNICRLETYERSLVAQVKRKYDELELALSPADRSRMLTTLLPLRRRLAKVTLRLGRSPVVKNV